MKTNGGLTKRQSLEVRELCSYIAMFIQHCGWVTLALRINEYPERTTLRFLLLDLGVGLGLQSARDASRDDFLIGDMMTSNTLATWIINTGYELTFDKHQIASLI